ncbi:Cell wall galactomannoprotein [Moelleriella libera RCEF 2490]|uniref:Cell wall galactomannoprotein n=1 Tax=Moelleriella libera RCEF 2490 TaxID=1081109 RepID=A0A168ASY1_9HYPO|nr:Cell wall galactomannoprotein [Moelleriella libera RCEF 2490]
MPLVASRSSSNNNNNRISTLRVPLLRLVVRLFRNIYFFTLNLLLSPMWIWPLFVSLLATLATATPSRRDATSINASLDKITQSLVALNNTLNTFNGGLVGTFVALQIQNQALGLERDIDAAAGTASQSAPLSDTESASVAFAITALTRNIYDVLDNIVRKKPQFDRAILGIGSASGLVRSDLQNLQSATDKFGAALTEKFVPAVKNLAPLLISAIDHHFEEALKVYS